MKKRFVLLTALCLSTALLSACGSSSDTGTANADDHTLVVLNYGKYLEADVLKMFEKETGIQVKLEEYESPEEMYTKFSAGSIHYDVVCTSDYMLERLIKEGQVEEINFDNFEYYDNLDPAIIKASQIFDPENKYSMPYFTEPSAFSTIRPWCRTRMSQHGTYCGTRNTKIPSSCRTLSVTVSLLP